MAVSKKFYRDKWNPNKVWEVARLVGGYYLRQYINGSQFGRGARVTKKHIESIGILNFEEVAGAR